MNTTIELALAQLASLGFRGRDSYLAELIPVVEMAWADGTIQPDERALLESYCQELTGRLNEQAGANLFSYRRALLLLKSLTQKRLSPAERQMALNALGVLADRNAMGAQMRERMIEWALAVGSIAGRPAWDTRELFWLQTMKRNFDVQVPKF
jgi:hypothetical protein